MSSPAPDPDDQTPPNHQLFIILPSKRPHCCIPQVTQSQTAENPESDYDQSAPHDEDNTYIHYHDSEYVHPTPLCPQRTTMVPNAPVVYSPDCTKICGKDAVAKNNAKTKKKRAAARNQIVKMQKRQKVVTKYSAKKNVFQFLCNTIIDVTLESTPSIPMSCFETIIRSANTHWKGNSRDNLVFDPYAALESTLL